MKSISCSIIQKVYPFSLLSFSIAVPRSFSKVLLTPAPTSSNKTNFAKLVLLDEVGAGVNRTLLKDLGTAIEKLNKEKGYTFCMIEHDMDFIGRLCDPVIVMAEGSVLFEGSVEDAKKDEKVIESYLGRGSKLKNN